MLWLACALLGVAATAAAQSVSDQSLARIARSLQKPPSQLTLDLPKADFYVFVDAPRPFADIFDLPPWVTPPQDFAAPRIAGNGRVALFGGVGVDPGAIGHAISKAVRTRTARREAMDAIVEYCKAHRDEPGASGICGGTPR
jgi:hypothetical protein